MNKSKLLLGIVFSILSTVGCMQNASDESDASTEASVMRGERGTGAYSKDLPGVMTAGGSVVGTRCANQRSALIKNILADTTLTNDQQDAKIRQVLELECIASNQAVNSTAATESSARPRLFYEKAAKGRSFYRFTYGYWPWHHVDTSSTTTITDTLTTYCTNIFGFSSTRCLAWLGWGNDWNNWYDYRTQYRSSCNYYSPYYYVTDYTYPYSYYDTLYDQWLGNCARRVVYINGQYYYY